MLARSKKHSTNTKKVKLLSEKEGDLSRDNIEVRNFVSTDNFSVRLLVVTYWLWEGVQ